MTKNKCVKCGENIKKNYNPEPSDKPSARIICDDCWTKINSKSNGLEEKHDKYTVNKIIEEIKKMDKELEQLRFEKSQTEAMLAFIIKQLGEVELNLKEILAADIKKVKIKKIESGVIKLYYESE
jgi:hypothetical protein